MSKRCPYNCEYCAQLEAQERAQEEAKENEFEQRYGGYLKKYFWKVAIVSGTLYFLLLVFLTLYNMGETPLPRIEEQDLAVPLTFFLALLVAAGGLCLSIKLMLRRRERLWEKMEQGL